MDIKQVVIYSTRAVVFIAAFDFMNQPAAMLAEICALQ
jgi:hypothetical protein